MSRTLDDIGDTLRRIVDVRSHARRHPWLVVGAVVAAGVVASALSTSAFRKGSRTKGRSEVAVPQLTRPGRTTLPPKKSSWFSAATTLLAGIVQTVAVNSLIAGIVAARDRRPVDAPSPGSAGEVERDD